MEKMDPPLKARGGRPLLDYDAVVAEMQASPGEWFRVLQGKAPSAGNTLKRREHVEVRTATTQRDPQRADIYARYVSPS